MIADWLADPVVHARAVQAEFGMGLITVVALTFLSAPYGRHGRAGWGPTVNPRLGWIVMESPSVLLWGYFFWLTLPAFNPVAICLLLVWMSHYVYRAYVYPLRMRVRPSDRMPILVPSLAVAFNILNAIVNAPVASGAVRAWDTSWFADPRFVLGVVMFFSGSAINHWADAKLRALRKPGQTGYQIPRGGLYELVSCPNYLGELLEWSGWAVATWSTGGLAFLVYTAANLVPRALQHHAWYRTEFADYPTGRRAIIPWVL